MHGSSGRAADPHNGRGLVSPQHLKTIDTERSLVPQTAICGSEYSPCAGPAPSSSALALRFICPMSSMCPDRSHQGQCVYFIFGQIRVSKREVSCFCKAHESRDEKRLL